MNVRRLLLLPIVIAAVLPASAGAQTSPPEPEATSVLHLDERGQVENDGGRWAADLNFDVQALKTQSVKRLLLVNDHSHAVPAPVFTLLHSNPSGRFALKVVENGCDGSVRRTPTLAPGASCAVRIAFAPLVPDDYQGWLEFGKGPVVSLHGSGVRQVMTPLTQTYGARRVSTTSAPVQIVYRNSTSRAIQMRTPLLTGRDPSTFRIVADGCGNRRLARLERCSVSVAFAPGVPGASQDLRPGEKQAQLVFGDVERESRDEAVTLSGSAVL